MDLKEVRKVLEDIFNKELSDGRNRHIVFWYDAEGEFVDDIDGLELDNAKLLKITDNNSFAIKYRLEVEDTDSNYLIYSPSPKPTPRENWLLDILKYSSEFSTDKTSLLLREFGADESLRNVFKKYVKFFNNQERFNKFASYNIEKLDAEKVNVAVLSALCKLQHPDFEAVVKTLLKAELNLENKYMKNIEKFGDVDAFWDLVQKKYGYVLPEKSLESLAISFMVTTLNNTLETDLPDTWQPYLLTKPSNAVVFTSNFMNHSVDALTFDELANYVEEQLDVNKYISAWAMEDYLHCEVFKAFDKAIISKLISNLLSDVGEFEKYRKIINARKTTHWYEHFEKEYEAIYFAMELLRMEKELGKTIKGQTAYDFVDNYTKKYYLLDLFYRKFYSSYDRIENKEPFTELAQKVENTYAHWYLDELSVKWSNIIEEELARDWQVKGLVQEKEFYRTYIAPHVRKEERVFVIISDALRYEAAKDFSNILNTERRGVTDIYFMQGTLPSKTHWGMASLLPHKTIEWKDKNTVAADDMSTNGTSNRQKVLQKYSQDAVAIQYDEIVDWNRQKYKEKFEGKRLIYIYHNVIDARGDNTSTEREVFDAVEKAFDELRKLVNKLINNLSATNIYITADHGFIYRRSPLQESDKVVKDIKNSLEEDRRYLLVEGEAKGESVLSIPMNYILGKDTNLKTVVPRGVTRFKVHGGGANYVHGGASLQEIIIPVIKFKNIRSKSDKYDVKKVDVKLTSISRKITNRITFLEFFQSEKVEDKKIPLRLKLYFVDEEGNKISNENIIIADSRSSKPEDRTYREKFTLKDINYNKEKQYYLILEDEDEKVEKIYEKIPFIIDLAITNDFDL